MPLDESQTTPLPKPKALLKLLGVPPHSKFERYTYRPPQSGSTIQPDESSQSLTNNNSTPIALRASSTAVEAHNVKFDLNYSNQMIRNELEHYTFWKHDIVTLINHCIAKGTLPISPTYVVEQFYYRNHSKNGDDGDEIEFEISAEDEAKFERLPKCMRDLKHTIFRDFLLEPDDAPPLPPDSTLTNEMRYGRFVTRVMAAVAELMSEDNEPAEKRQCSGYFHNKAPLPDTINIHRKPDLVFAKEGIPLTDGERGGPKHRCPCRLLDAAAELKFIENADVRSDEEFMTTVAPKLNNLAFCFFESQDNRRFVFLPSVLGTDVRLSFYDRSGSIHSSKFNIIEHPELFLHILIALTFAANEVIGFDPTIVGGTKGEGILRYVTVKGVRYEILNEVWRSVSIEGRATTCWLVRDEAGREFIIKDFWHLEARVQSEVDFLDIVKELYIEGVPEYVGYEDVVINGRLDSTDNNHGVVEKKCNRVHRRIVFAKPATPITRFLSLKELVTGFMDCVRVHMILYYEHKILHCDISVYNMMLYKPDGCSFPRRGMLIDLSYAMDCDEERRKRYTALAAARLKSYMIRKKKEEAAKDRGVLRTSNKQNTSTQPPKKPAAKKTKRSRLSLSELKLQEENMKKYEEKIQLHGMRSGTHPFIAAETLVSLHSPGYVHKVEYDLESFYHCFLFFCLLYTAAGVQLKKGSVPKFFHNWLHPELHDATLLGESKQVHIGYSPEDFAKTVLCKLTDYMLPLKNCLARLHELLRSKTMTHQAMIRVFEETLAELPDEPVDRDDPKDDVDVEVDEDGNIDRGDNDDRDGDDDDGGNSDGDDNDGGNSDDDSSKGFEVEQEYKLKAVDGAFDNDSCPEGSDVDGLAKRMNRTNLQKEPSSSTQGDTSANPLIVLPYVQTSLGPPSTPIARRADKSALPPMPPPVPNVEDQERSASEPVQWGGRNLRPNVAGRVASETSIYRETSLRPKPKGKGKSKL